MSVSCLTFSDTLWCQLSYYRDIFCVSPTTKKSLEYDSKYQSRNVKKSKWCWSWNFIFVYFKNLALLCTIMYCWWEKLKISPFFRHHSCILSRLNSEYFKTPGKKLWFKSIPQEKYSLYKKASRELSSLQL